MPFLDTAFHFIFKGLILYFIASRLAMLVLELASKPSGAR